VSRTTQRRERHFVEIPKTLSEVPLPDPDEIKRKNPKKKQIKEEREKINGNKEDKDNLKRIAAINISVRAYKKE